MRFSLLFCIFGLAGTTAFAQTPASNLRKDLNTDSTKVYRDVEQRPAFNGNWSSYLQDHLDFPMPVLSRVNADTTLAKAGFKEQVVVQFIVCEDGGLCNMKILKCNPDYPELGTEVLRVLKLSPTWRPGQVNGVPVKSYFSLPVTFSTQ